jgi:hypothetical protein
MSILSDFASIALKSLPDPGQTGDVDFEIHNGRARLRDAQHVKGEDARSFGERNCDVIPRAAPSRRRRCTQAN